MKLDPAHDLLGNEDRDGAWVATCACGRTFLAAEEKAAADLWLDHEVGEAVGAAPVVQGEGRRMICKKCGKEIPWQPPHAGRYRNTDNGLHLTFDGGYGEFIDAPFVNDQEVKYILCHECAHDLCDWLGVDAHNWHTHGIYSGQHDDHHDREER